MNHPRDNIEPLSPELESLISAASGDDGPSEETRARLYGRLSSTLALPPAPLPPGGESMGLMSKAAALLPSVKPVLVSALVASGIGLAGIAGYVAMGPSSSKESNEVSSPKADSPLETQRQMRVEKTHDTLRLAATPREQTTQKEASSPIPETVPTTAKTGSKKAGAPPGKHATKYTMAEERRLIEAARQSLREGEVDQALSLLARHHQLFKTGHFLEERDALYILSLSKKGRYLSAKRAAKRFFKKYPNTVFKDAVSAALRSAPE